VRSLFRHNDNTIVSLKKLREELERVRKMGFAVDDEEEQIGARCIGAPVLDIAGGPLPPSASPGPRPGSRRTLPTLTKDLREMASAISENVKSIHPAAGR
jgi:DNA-binding IclR family transcriptional regulator